MNVFLMLVTCVELEQSVTTETRIERSGSCKSCCSYVAAVATVVGITSCDDFAVRLNF